jgi:hypothetical protein
MIEYDSTSVAEDADIDTLVEQIGVSPPDWHAAPTLGSEVSLAISETLRKRGLRSEDFRPRPVVGRVRCFSPISARGTTVLPLALAMRVWNE